MATSVDVARALLGEQAEDADSTFDSPVWGTVTKVSPVFVRLDSFDDLFEFGPAQLVHGVVQRGDHVLCSFAEGDPENLVVFGPGLDGPTGGFSGVPLDESVTDAKVAPDAGIAESKIANLTTDLSSKVGLAGTETITGDKTFRGKVIVGGDRSVDPRDSNYAGGILANGAANDTAAWQAGINALADGGRIIHPGGTSLATGLTVPIGKRVALLAETGVTGPCILQSSTGTILTVGDGTNNTEGFKTDVTFKAGADLAWDTPLLDLKRTRYFDLDVSFDLGSFTATGLRLDGSYNGRIRRRKWILGKYGVGAEFVSTNAPAAQMDTVQFDAIPTGNFGVIVRDAPNGWNNLSFTGKIVSADNLVPVDTTVSSGGTVGSTALTVASATGITAGDPVFIGLAGNAEVNKVTSVSGSVLTLARGLRFAQAAGQPVFNGGVGISLSGNTFDVQVRDLHTEKLRASILLGSTVVGMTVEGCDSTAKGMVVFGGGSPSDIWIGPNTSPGYSSQNIVAESPSWSTATPTRVDVAGPFGTRGAITLVQSSLLTTTHGRVRTRPSGIWLETHNVASANSASKRLQTTGTGTELFSEDYAGKHVWNGDTNLYRSSAGVLKTDGQISASAFVGLGAAGPLFGRVTSDQAKTSDTTLVDLTGLGFAIAASEIWTFEYVLFYDGSTVGDLKVRINWPSGASARWGGSGGSTAISAVTGTPTFATSNATATALAYGGAGAGTIMRLLLQGIVRNGATAGNVQLQFAQNASDATATTVYTDSYMLATQVA